MAHLYIGNPAKVVAPVVDAIKTLDDDIYAFIEFDIWPINMDVALFRPSPCGWSTIIVTEVKRLSRPVRGMDNGPWQIQREDGEWETLAAYDRHVNPYHQAVHCAEAWRDWLANNQALFRRGKEIVPKDHFRPWPDLLLINGSGKELRHELPCIPSTHFGQWFDDVEVWRQHIATWVQRRRSVSLTGEEITRLAAVLGLTPLSDSALPLSTSVPAPDAADNPVALSALMTWFNSVDARLRRLESSISGLGEQSRSA